MFFKIKTNLFTILHEYRTIGKNQKRNINTQVIEPVLLKQHKPYWLLLQKSLINECS